jgi:hypothetical protein
VTSHEERVPLQYHCSQILECGSSKRHLQLLAVLVAEICSCSCIDFYPQWIPRDMNRIADGLSCWCQSGGDDWQPHPILLCYLDVLWGPHTADRFANVVNAQLPVLNCKRYYPGTRRIDAFAFTDLVRIIGFDHLFLQFCEHLRRFRSIVQ